MKALVTYFTQTGTPRKSARAIFNAVEVEKEILPFDKVKNVHGYDIVFIGFPLSGMQYPSRSNPSSKGFRQGRKWHSFPTPRFPERRTALEAGLRRMPSGLATGKKVLGHFGVPG